MCPMIMHQKSRDMCVTFLTFFKEDLERRNVSSFRLLLRLQLFVAEFVGEIRDIETNYAAQDREDYVGY